MNPLYILIISIYIILGLLTLLVNSRNDESHFTNTLEFILACAMIVFGWVFFIAIKLNEPGTLNFLFRKHYISFHLNRFDNPINCTTDFRIALRYYYED